MLIGFGVYAVYRILDFIYGRLGSSNKTWESEDLELVMKNPVIKSRLGDNIVLISTQHPKKLINDEGCKAYSYSFILRGTRGQVIIAQGSILS